MPNIIADRVLETSITTGLGSYTLAGAVLGFRTVASVASIGDTFTYCAEDINPTTGQNIGGWEVGLGTVVGTNTVQRTQIYSSSNANAAVNWTSGTRRIALSVTTNTIAVGNQSAGLMSAADKTKIDSITGTNTGDNATNSQYAGLVTNATHTGDATGSGALTVVGVNGTILSGLSTGILKNSTGTGVPSIAAAGTDYQEPLVSGTNIKTINGSSVLGSGDMTISGGGGDPAGWVLVAPVTWSGNTSSVTAALDWTTYQAFKLVGTASFGNNATPEMHLSLDGGATYSTAAAYSCTHARVLASNAGVTLESATNNSTSFAIFVLGGHNLPASSGTVEILITRALYPVDGLWMTLFKYETTGVAGNTNHQFEMLDGVARFKAGAVAATNFRITTGCSGSVTSAGNLKLLGLPV